MPGQTSGRTQAGGGDGVRGVEREGLPGRHDPPSPNYSEADDDESEGEDDIVSEGGDSENDDEQPRGTGSTGLVCGNVDSPPSGPWRKFPLGSGKSGPRSCQLY